MTSESLPLIKNDKKMMISWGLYDWANSSFAVIIQTFILPAYFVRAVVNNESIGTASWGFNLGLTGILIAVGGPLIGASADQAGGRKKWLLFFTYINIIACALMWFIQPHHNDAFLALLLFSIAAISSEFAYIFYNSMLPTLATSSHIGRWSGWGWGMGYIGGMFSLVTCLVLFIDPSLSPFNLDRTRAEDIRASLVLVAFWYSLFSLPLFLNIPSTPTKMPLIKAVVLGLTQLKQFFTDIKQNSFLYRFFVARMFFIDGLLTLFAFGGIFAAQKFNMSSEKVLVFGIVLNITAGMGALALAFLDDKFGPRKLMIGCLISLIILVSLTIYAQSEIQFWICGMFVGMFVGPLQASARSYLAKIAPPDLMSQMFGFFSFSGKATSFLGPLLISAAVYFTGSLTLGMSTIILFFTIGLLLLLTIQEV